MIREKFNAISGRIKIDAANLLIFCDVVWCKYLNGGEFSGLCRPWSS